jgi:superoxide dismutase, Fe-Mn family
MSHQLPTLPYAYDALEPAIDAKTMEIHYTKHHASYVTKLNEALEKEPRLQNAPLEQLLSDLASVPNEIRQAVRNHGGGHLNHSFFWKIMSKNKVKAPVGDLAQGLKKHFGSIEGFKEAFTKEALNRFGSGWAWLSFTKDGGLIAQSTANQDNPWMEGRTPILGLDVWEHAYYLNYQNRRPDYISAWWNTIDWEAANQLYLRAMER